MQKLTKLRNFPQNVWRTEYEGWGIITDDTGKVIRSQVVLSGLDLNLHVMGNN